MWFGFREDNAWYPLNVERVNEILLMNREGKKPASLEENVAAEKESTSSLNSDLVSLDKKFRDKSGNKKKRSGRNAATATQTTATQITVTQIARITDEVFCPFGLSGLLLLACEEENGCMRTTRILRSAPGM